MGLSKQNRSRLRVSTQNKQSRLEDIFNGMAMSPVKIIRWHTKNCLKKCVVLIFEHLGYCIAYSVMHV